MDYPPHRVRVGALEEEGETCRLPSVEKEGGAGRAGQTTRAWAGQKSRLEDQGEGCGCAHRPGL